MSLNPSLKNQQAFLNLFYSPACIDSFALTKKTKISLYILRIDSSSFDYEALYKNLGNASISYVLSRLRNEEYYKNQKVWEQVQEATKKFRNWGINEGEGGELLLYCFLESHLNAPKIISKMEIKDDSQDYIKGSDGIHLLRLDENNYQLIYGESKMIAKLEKAIYEALKSLSKLKKEGFASEVSLIDSNLMKETYDDQTISFLRAILIPTASNIATNNAFGVFLGFEVDINDWDLQDMTDQEFKEKLIQTIEKEFKDKFEYIKKRIEEENLEGHNFYFYALPFLKRKDSTIDDVRKKIIKKIQNNGN